MSKYIFSMHGECPKDVLTKGWMVETYELGRDPYNLTGVDLSSWSGYGTIARLNHGYYPNGTIPLPQYYQDFAIRCANFVMNTVGCDHFIIGNEPNHSQEWPQQRIYANEYVECYNLCYQEIKNVVPSAKILPAAIAPWNAESGDWLEYFQYILDNIVDCDSVTLHTYTHGADPSLIYSEAKMGTPYQDRYYNFYAYRDFMDRIPGRFSDVPVYITETDQNDPWLNVNQGWVRNAYQEIDNWNKTHAQKIQCLSLYRWQYDQWEIKGRDNVILDFLAAQENEYTIGDGMEEIFSDGFEGNFYYADDPYTGETDVSELECPEGWIPYWVQGSQPGIMVRPEYKPRVRPAPEVEFGNKCVGIHTTSASHDGVLYKTLSVQSGETVKATAQAMGKGDGAHGMVLGIDPTGGTDFQSSDVVWGKWWSTDEPDWIEGAWAQIEAEAIASSSSITVYLRTNARYANSNAAHFDEVSVSVDGGGTTPPPSGGGLQDYINALQADINSLQTDLDALQAFVDNGAIKALLI